MRVAVLILALFFTEKIAASAPDWGMTGHRVVGEIAEKHLTKRAKRKIQEIIGTESVAISSNWSDFIKSEMSMRQFDNWHYVNIPSGLNLLDFSNRLKQDTATNAFNRIEFLVAELKKKDLTLTQKQFRLKMLIHIVGDIHQPMHVGHLEDKGGNDIKVMWFDEATNLHSVWDTHLIDYQKLSYSEYERHLNHVTKEQKETWQKQPLAEWLFESYQSAEKLYAGINQPNQRLSYRYNYDNLALLEQQLLKGGVRLAGLLNQIFAD